MMVSLTRRLGGPRVATGLALALGIISGVPAQGASAGGWQRVYRNSNKTQNILYGMAAPSGSDQWAVGVWGNSALVMHGNGSRWSRVTVPGQAGAELIQVAATSAGNVWAFGNRDDGSAGMILHYDGSSWQSVPPPAGVGPSSAAVISRTDVWIGGQEGCTGTSCTTDMYHWNGAGWSTAYTLPELINAMSGMAHWTGHRWVNSTPGLSFTGTDAFPLRGLARVPGRSTLWAGGQVQRTPTSKVWDSLIARYP
jgi:hypothetical protein